MALGSAGLGLLIVAGSAARKPHSNPGEEISLLPSSSGSFSYSYKGQTVGDACQECLTRHYSKALGLLKEAERFSVKEGKITIEARDRIRSAIEEMVTAEEDLGSGISDKRLTKSLEAVDVMQRAIRKSMWAEKLPTTEESLDKLRVVMAEVKDLVDLTYKISEDYHGKVHQAIKLIAEKTGK